MLYSLSKWHYLRFEATPNSISANYIKSLLKFRTIKIRVKLNIIIGFYEFQQFVFVMIQNSHWRQLKTKCVNNNNINNKK